MARPRASTPAPLLLLFLVLLIALLALPSQGQSLAGLKVINALPPPILDFSFTFVDVLVDGELVFSKVEYLFGSSNGTHGPYRPLEAPGSYNVSFRYSNHPELGVVASTRLQIAQPGTYHTVVIFGRNTIDFPIQTAHLIDQSVGGHADAMRQQDQGLQIRVVEEEERGDRGATDKGAAAASIRYFNAGISLGPTTVTLNGKDLFPSTPYGQAWSGGQYAELEVSRGSSFTFAVVDARYEEIEITFDKLPLTAGCAFTLFSTGVLGNYYSPFIIVATRDLCTKR
jgi:hypothetical protein